MRTIPLPTTRFTTRPEEAHLNWSVAALLDDERKGYDSWPVSGDDIARWRAEKG